MVHILRSSTTTWITQKCTLSISVEGAKLWQLTDTMNDIFNWEGPQTPKDCTNRNLRKSSREKCNVLHLSWNDSLHPYVLGGNWLSSSAAEKYQEVTVDVRLDELIVHCHWKADVFCTTLGGAWLADLGKLFSLLPDTGEAAYDILSSLELLHCRGLWRNWRASSRRLPQWSEVWSRWSARVCWGILACLGRWK